MSFQYVCSWCRNQYGKTDTLASDGVCDSCYETITRIPTLTAEQLDELPFGVIELGRKGEIIAYNRAESDLSRRKPADVIGHNFFNEIAPCTKVAEFQDRFYELYESAEEMLQEFDFVFPFKHGKTEVQILFYKDEAK